MPFLLYGVTESPEAVADLPFGVAGAIVQRMEVSRLTCFYSENSTLTASNTRETALEFHRVVNSLCEKTEIIPFRFPTLLNERAEIASEIEKHAAEYYEGLANIRGRVQIEIRIHFRDDVESDSTRAAANSGADYLRYRYDHHLQLQSATVAVRSAAGELIERWREREYSDHLRCFALIARGSFAAVQAALSKAEISSNLLARVSGPWPATEFLKEE
jgi:Gas vesicle synthesis protein GvpL/GvpF